MSSDPAAKPASRAGFRTILVHDYLADLEAFHQWAAEKLP